MKLPVLLVIVCVTFMLGAQVSTSCSCSGYVTSKGAGECRTNYRGKKFCYVNQGQCSDQIKGSSSSRLWSYQACQGYTVRGNQCQFPFSYKQRTFSSCTTFDSENGAAWCTTTEGRYEDCGVFSNTLSSSHKQSDKQGQYYTVNEDGFISCQTEADCTPDFETSNHRVSYSCGGYNEKEIRADIWIWIQGICAQNIGTKEQVGITCGSGKRADSCKDCGTTEEQCNNAYCYIQNYDNSGPTMPYCTETSGAAGASFLILNSPIGGTGISRAINPDRYDECGPRYCRRRNKCCFLVYIGWSNRYLGCPQYC